MNEPLSEDRRSRSAGVAMTTSPTQLGRTTRSRRGLTGVVAGTVEPKGSRQRHDSRSGVAMLPGGGSVGHGICDACVEHARECSGDRFNDEVEFPQGQLAVIKLAIHQSPVGERSHERFDAAGGWIGEGSCRTFDCIGDHEDSAFP